ncbi:hypothetical protein [Geodermatophilus sp. SYSU D00815]
MAAAAASLLALSGTAQAAGTTYVSAEDLGTPLTGATSSCQVTESGWCTYQRGAGTVALVDVEGDTHLQLSTPVDGNAKAFALEYDHRGALLSSIRTISYDYLVTAPGSSDPRQAPAINVEIVTEAGVPAVLVYEPLYAVAGYANPTTWSSQTPTSAEGGWWTPQSALQQELQAAQDDPSEYGGATWADVLEVTGNATTMGIGVNQGGGNAGLVSLVDLLTVDDTVYDFGAEPAPEPPAKPATAEDCKNGGWRTYTDPAFPNQGQCIQFVNTGKVGQGAAGATPRPSAPSVGKVRAA